MPNETNDLPKEVISFMKELDELIARFDISVKKSTAVLFGAVIATLKSSYDTNERVALVISMIHMLTNTAGEDE